MEKPKRTVRKPETEARYAEYLKEKQGACPFCFTDNVPREVLKKFEYWFITANLFPYDKDYSDNASLVPFRHVEHIWDLSTDELDEYWMIRKQMPEMDYDELLENMPRGRTQIHYHQHLLKY